MTSCQHVQICVCIDEDQTNRTQSYTYSCTLPRRGRPRMAVSHTTPATHRLHQCPYLSPRIATPFRWISFTAIATDTQTIDAAVGTLCRVTLPAFNTHDTPGAGASPRIVAECVQTDVTRALNVAALEFRLGLRRLSRRRLRLHRLGLHRLGLHRLGLHRLGLRRLGLHRHGLRWEKCDADVRKKGDADILEQSD